MPLSLMRAANFFVPLLLFALSFGLRFFWISKGPIDSDGLFLALQSEKTLHPAILSALAEYHGLARGGRRKENSVVLRQAQDGWKDGERSRTTSVRCSPFSEEAPACRQAGMNPASFVLSPEITK